MTDLLNGPATRQAAAVAAREVSAEELVGAAVEAAADIDASINALVTNTFEAALERARELDQRQAANGTIGPLHGVPMTIKDSFLTQGVRTTAGTTGLASHVPTRNATVVARLLEAGAVLLGKSNTSELTLRFAAENFVAGRTSNPYDASRSPGGSSGGAAALVASGVSAFDFGSDTGGSIRVPAHFCGVAGLKPTRGRIPRTGHIPFLDFGPCEAFTQVGPIARSVADLSILYEITAGPDDCDPAAVPRSVAPVTVPIKGLRIAHYCDNGVSEATRSTVATVEQSVRRLEEAGARVNDATPPGVNRSASLWRSLFLCDGGAAVRRKLDAFGTTTPHPLLSWTSAADPVDAETVTRLIDDWNALVSSNLSFMADLDAVICPVSATPAPRHGEPCPIDYTYHQNLLGWPVAVIRCGTDDAGLPIGVQIVSKPWREDICLSIAECLENALGGWRPPAAPDARHRLASSR